MKQKMKAMVLSKKDIEDALLDFEFLAVEDIAFPAKAYSDGRLYDANGHLVWDAAPDGWLAEWVQEEGEEV